MHFFNSFLDHLVHAATVCPLGRAFLNHLFALRSTLKPGQVRRINADTRAELAWWALFLDKWQGLSVQQFIILRQPDQLLFCDASGSWGCGAWAPPFWFQFPWLRDTPLSSIALKELFPIVAATGVWGRYWAGKLILCHSDNAPAVTQVNSLHAQNPLAAHLLKSLALFQALIDFRLRAVHIRVQTTSGQTSCPGIKLRIFLAHTRGIIPFLHLCPQH